MNQTSQSSPAATLPFLGVLRLAGPEAAAFLQGQVTHDTALLADGRTLLAACNTPQGRVVALMRLRQSDGIVYALLPADLVEVTAAHLRRFVLRAKADVQVAADLQVASPRQPANVASGLISFDYGSDRQVIVAPRPALDAVSGRSPGEWRQFTESDWWCADIAAGLPQVFRASSAAFVPQMLNLDLLGAIGFRKGCYPGQEIVARTQNLGRIKRRLFRYHVAGATLPAPGEALHLGAARVGEVVRSASTAGAAELLAVVSLEAAGLGLTDASGTVTCSPEPLPYAVPEAEDAP